MIGSFLYGMSVMFSFFEIIRFIQETFHYNSQVCDIY